MKKRMLADVLWEAANVHLLTRESRCDEAPLEFSCNAAIAAELGAALGTMHAVHSGAKKSAALTFLESLGCSKHFPAWGEFDTQRRQSVRFMWLLLAMHVAEDEGLTV